MPKIILTFLVFLLSTICLSAQIGLQLDDFRAAIAIKKPTSNTTTAPYPTLLEVFKATTPLTSTPKAYCYNDLAFFCKLEVEFEKTSRFPVKFRLGDIDQVDWLEGKNNYLIK